MKTCPSCGSELEFLGDHGIADYEDRWNAQAMKYRCKRGLHVVFITEAAEVDEDIRTPWVEAMECLWADMGDAFAKDHFTVENLRYVRLNADSHDQLEEVVCSNLEDLRSAAAKRMVAAFEGSKVRLVKYADASFDFIEALKLVDEELQNYGDRLEQLGWKTPDAGGSGGSTSEAR